MEVGIAEWDEGLEHSISIDLGFHFNGAPAPPPPLKLDPLPQAPLNNASASSVPLPWAQNSENENSEMSSANRLDLNKSPPFKVQDDLQKDFNDKNGSLRVNNKQEKDGIRKRMRLSGEQYVYLEECFKQNSELDNIRMEALAKELNISHRQVHVWFQNRKQRNKSTHNEMDCNVWKRYYEALRKQNKKLRKELEEIKALKQAKETQSRMVCPSCKTVFSPQFTTSASNQY